MLLFPRFFPLRFRLDCISQNALSYIYSNFNFLSHQTSQSTSVTHIHIYMYMYIYVCIWKVSLSLQELIDHALKDCFKTKLCFTGKFHHFIFNLLFQIINSFGKVIFLSVP